MYLSNRVYAARFLPSGGVIGGAGYIIGQVVTGNEIKPGELAGSVVSGAIVGGVAGSGVGLGALGAAGVGAGAGFTGSVVEQVRK